MLGVCGWRQTAASDLLPPQANLLLQLLNLAVTVSFLLALLLTPHVAFHQLNGCNKRLGDAEMGIFLQHTEVIKKHSEAETRIEEYNRIE